MARLVGSGAEESPDLVTAPAIWTAVTGAGTTIDTGTVHSGLRSIKIAPTTSAQTTFRKDIANDATVGRAFFSRRYINMIAFGSGIDPTIFETRSSGNVPSLIIRAMRTGVFQMENSVSGTTRPMSTAITLGVWYRIETKHVQHDSAGTMEMRLYLGDSTSILESVSLTGEDTLPTNTASFYFGQLTNPSTTCSFYLDDVVVQDSTGTFANDWPGPGKFYCDKPVSNSSIGWLDDDGVSAADFSNVDEAPAASIDDATTFNATTSTSAEDKLFINGPGSDVPANATMLTMEVWARVSAPDAVSGTMAVKAWDDLGTGTQGAAMTVNSATWRLLTAAEHLTVNLAGKVKNDLFSYAIGYKALSGASRKAVTAVYANIEWTETPAGARVPLRYMLRPQ